MRTMGAPRGVRLGAALSFAGRDGSTRGMWGDGGYVHEKGGQTPTT